MKRILGSMFILLFIISCYSCVFCESQDYAHEIWQAMGEAGNMDMSKAWEFKGVFSFGETTGDGEVTLILTEDQSRIKNPVSLHNCPADDSAITLQFFPMLKCLLMKLDQNESEETFEAWIREILPVVLLARQNNLFFRSAVREFNTMTAYIQFDNKYNELYCLVTCTETNNWFSVK